MTDLEIRVEAELNKAIRYWIIEGQFINSNISGHCKIELENKHYTIEEYKKISHTGVKLSNGWSRNVSACISETHYLTEEFIDYFWDLLHKECILESQKLNERQIIKYVTKPHNIEYDKNHYFKTSTKNKNFDFQTCSDKFKLLYGKYFI